MQEFGSKLREFAKRHLMLGAITAPLTLGLVTATAVMKSGNDSQPEVPTGPSVTASADSPDSRLTHVRNHARASTTADE